MSEFEDGLRSALADAADSYEPSSAMTSRIESAVARRERRRRRIVAGSVGVLALSLSLGVAGAELMSSTTGGDDQAGKQIGQPKTEHNTAPSTEHSGPTSPGAPIVPVQPGQQCTPKPLGSANLNSGHDASFSGASTGTLRGLAQLSDGSAHMTSGAATGSNSSISSGSSATASITTGSATASNSSTTTLNTSNGPPGSVPPPAPPPPPPPGQPEQPTEPVLGEVPHPASVQGTTIVKGASAAQTRSGVPSTC